MPFYYSIDEKKESERKIAKGLLRLKDALDEAGIPPSNLSATLLLATWNIREFDSRSYGVRGKESLFYIAEIVSAFDLVAVQEVREDLEALHRLVDYLGGWWKYLLTDVTQGRRGNRERMAFLYDSRKIRFGGLASQVVIPPVERRGKEFEPAKQLARTPFMVGFKAGWFNFTLCTAHIYYGDDKPDEPDRLEEIRLLAEFLADRAKEAHAWAKNIILLGDFNIFSPEDETMKAIIDAGFQVPKQLQRLPSNVPQDKFYDQIAFIAPDVEDHLDLSKAGVFNFFDHVYREEDEELYSDAMGKAYLRTSGGEERDEKERTAHYRKWRTYQMSDHLPMWIELKTDFGREYLQRKAK